MRFTLLLVLLSLTADAQGRFSRFCGRGAQGRSDRGLPCDDVTAGFAQFEAFNGTGTTTACSTTAPTSAQGSALTFTRASNGTCTKTASGGLATTGIANGDLVVLSTNQSRVEYDSAGTLGLLAESSRTNSALQSEAIDNAVWSNSAGTAVAPTLNGANTVVAPDGNTTADDYSFPATGTLEWSSRTQPAACPTGARSSSIYARAIGSSFTFDLCDSDGSSYVCGTCTAVTTSWTRCTYSRPSAIGTGNSFVGNFSNFNGGTARSAGRVALWGFQCEAGTYVTSYIPTTTVAVTRAAETASFPFALAISPLSIAATRWGPATSAAQANTVMVAVPAVTLGEGSNLSLLYGNSSGLRCYNNGNADTRVAFASASPERGWCAIDSANATPANRVQGEWPTGSAMADGVTASGGTAAGVGVLVGSFGGGTSYADGIISRVCIDTTTTRCR